LGDHGKDDYYVLPESITVNWNEIAIFKAKDGAGTAVDSTWNIVPTDLGSTRLLPDGTDVTAPTDLLGEYWVRGTSKANAALRDAGKLVVHPKIVIEKFDRVIPGEGNEKNVTITLTPSPLPAGYSVSLKCKATQGSGGALLSTETITETTTVKVRGTVQSWGAGDVPAPDNMELSAQCMDVVAKENFTICAHAKDLVNTRKRDRNDHQLYVEVSWASDSGNVSDLDEYRIRERVAFSPTPIPAPFAFVNGPLLITGNPCVYPVAGFPADSPFEDEHSLPLRGLRDITDTPEEGQFQVDQVYEGACRRCGPGSKTALGEYTIIQETYSKPPRYYRCTKSGPGLPAGGTSREVELN